MTFFVMTAILLAVTGFVLGWFYAYRDACQAPDSYRNDSLGTYSEMQSLRVTRHTDNCKQKAPASIGAREIRR